ncbi:MAG: hypothetical protein K0S38_538 [Candidatus Paceibacter sp.]|jgi:hypothetical protein|nr:hypothetical protein [Candidatus Paceibacter sp.]
MGRLEDAAKVLHVPVDQLPAVAVHRYNDEEHRIAWIRDALLKGAMPGIIKQLCDEVLTPLAPSIPLVQPSAPSNLEAA